MAMNISAPAYLINRQHTCHHFHLIQENRVSRPLSKVLGGTYRPNLTSEVAHSDLRILHEFALFGSLSISRDDLVGFIGWLTAPVSDKTVALVEDVVLRCCVDRVYSL